MPGGPNRLAFDVASVKPFDPKSRTGVVSWTGNPQDGLRENSNLEFFVEQAYRVNSVQILGEAAWMQNETWQIEAKTTGPAPMADRILMLQTLLADRFKLVLHTETRMLPVYSLVVAKGGVKMQPAEAGAPQGSAMGQTLIRGTMSTASLANALTGATGRIVTDKTGLSGLYTVNLRWAADPADNGPSLVTAVEDLGLKLQAEKALVQVYVIDHAERPSQN